MNIHKGDDSYGHVLKYMSLFGSVQGLTVLVNLVRNKAVALLLGPQGMGLLSLLNASVNFISQSTNFGLSASAVKHLSENVDGCNSVNSTKRLDDERIRHYVSVLRSWELLTAVIGMVACVVIGPMLNDATFSWGDHTLHFMLLAPAIGMMAVTGGEMAILKAMRKLRTLAVMQVYTVIATLLLTIILFYYFGQSAIVPVIVLSTGVSCAMVLWFSLRLFPLRLHGYLSLLREGLPMVKLGMAFVVAGAFGSGAELLIRSYLNVNAGLDDVGLYNAGYMLLITLGGLLMASLDADYFPRLSAVNSNQTEVNTLANQQIEVGLTLAMPVSVVTILFSPIIVPMLLSSEFLPIVPMVQVASFSLLFKVIAVPLSFQTLSKGDALSFVLLEMVTNIVMVVFLIVGYNYNGLHGMGMAITLMWVAELLIVYFYTRWRYGFRFSGKTLGFLFRLFPVVIAAYAASFVSVPYVYWSLACAIMIASAWFSFVRIQQERKDDSQ